MSTQWTVEQVQELSPDASNFNRGKSLASTGKWQSLSLKDQIVWGLCKGSGKNPYKAQIDLAVPSFKCSCPSRKFPCKHGIGLMLLYISSLSSFTEEAPPDWVQEWLDKRGASAEKKAKKAEEGEKPLTDRQIKNKEKRAAEKQQKIAAGIKELQTWLLDTIQAGTAELSQQPFSYFEERKASMWDAQVKGMGNAILELHSTLQQNNWQEKAVTQLAQMYLITRGFDHLDQLDPPIKQDVLSIIGSNTDKKEVLEAGEAVSDQWFVLSKKKEQDANLSLTSQRIWLLGKKTQRYALLLDFAFGSQPIMTSYLPGTTFEAEFAFYPSNYPSRALVKKTISDKVDHKEQLTGFAHFNTFLSSYAEALGKNPFIHRFPLLIEKLIPVHQNNNWILIDQERNELPIRKGFNQHWELLALSGGHPLQLFAEWDGESILPLGVQENKHWISY